MKALLTAALAFGLLGSGAAMAAPMDQTPKHHVTHHVKHHVKAHHHAKKHVKHHVKHHRHHRKNHAM